MLGIHVSEGTAEGWFGQGKRSAVLSIVIIAVLILGIAFGIFAAVNPKAETGISQPNAPIAPTTPAAPTPTAPAPAEPTPATPTTPQDKPEGKIWTVEELILELLANPDKYERGTIFQISGVYNRLVPGLKGADFYFGPPAIVYSQWYHDNREVWVIIAVDDKERETMKAWDTLKMGDRVVVRAIYAYADQGGALFMDSTIISVTPVK